MRYGYARVSSAGQSLEIQLADLNAHGCEKILSEKVSGASADNRPQLRLLLDFMQAGDELIITRLDRLARSTLDLCRIVDELERKKCTIACTQQSIETKTPTGRLLVTMLGAIATFENELRHDRQMAGIALARARCAYKGKQPTHNYEAIRIEMQLNAHLSKRQLAKKLNCGRSTIDRAMEYRQKEDA